MPGEETVVLQSEGIAPEYEGGEEPRPKYRKWLLMLGLAVFLALAFLVGFLLIRKYWFSPETEPVQSAPVAEEATTTPVLPDLGSGEEEPAESATSTLSNIAVEYLSFADFYQAPVEPGAVNLKDYTLPLNVKIDVMNYYDVSRKLSLDPYLDSLDNQGFAVIDNPWSKEAGDFASLYSSLDSKQLPFLITSDFLIYYHQNLLKKTFKDIEENVFYDNLWDINKELYQSAKSRYEARLAAIGNINDPVLEAERLETAFFATSLELLKPAANQLAPKGTTDNKEKFAATEADKFYFVVPPYLRDDVLAEVSLIRAGQAVRAKSPVLLYSRNYTEFVVPSDYKQNAKLNNFYLATRWLNSVFPLNYRTQDCPNCLLDRADWRISLTAASLIAQDFSAQPELKNRWARIYKIMSYFQGLREDLNYIHYRNSLNELFGEGFKSEEIFDTKNDEALADLDKLRLKLISYSWPEISGAYDKSAQKERAGLKVLAEPYWPNSYVFSRLTTPKVGAYLGTTTTVTNQTICPEKQGRNRCYGLALDPINLVYPAASNAYFAENSNYKDYDRQANALREELAAMNAWHSTSYWATLSLVKAYLAADKSKQPLFARSSAWRDQALRTAAAAWINLQLPLQKFTLSSVSIPDQSLGFKRNLENSYIDPNLPLMDEILAVNDMMIKMLNALQLDLEARLAVSDIRIFSSRLSELRAIAVKELNGESLSQEDNEKIAEFVRELSIETSGTKDRQTEIKMPSGQTMHLDLSKLKLLVLIHQEGDNKVFSVGPVWDYRESR